MSDKDVIDEEDERAFRARNNGIPMDFAGQQRSMIHLPTAHEVRAFSKTRIRTCGDCKHFARRHFAGEQDKFIATLVHEQEWKTEFLGDDPDKLGLCADKGNVVTGPSVLACSNYRRRE